MNPIASSDTRAGARAWRWVAWGAAIAASLGVFALYVRADFMVTLADMVWACFQ
jgi:hypothetical protein